MNKKICSHLLFIITLSICFSINFISFLSYSNDLNQEIKKLSDKNNSRNIQVNQPLSYNNSIQTNIQTQPTPQQKELMKNDLNAANKFLEKKIEDDKKQKEIEVQKKSFNQKLKNSVFVEKKISLEYKNQQQPKKLYEREFSASNQHLPPIYFKSYYLALAFKAAEKNDFNSLRALLNTYSFLNGQNIEGDTILMHAIQHGSIDVARLLIAKGAFIDAVNNRQRTALHYASTLGDIEILKLLLSMGADYTIKDDINMTALDYAIANGQDFAAQTINLYIEDNKKHR